MPGGLFSLIRNDSPVSGMQRSWDLRELQAGKESLMKEKYTRAQPGQWHSPSRWLVDPRKTWREMVSKGKPPSAGRKEDSHFSGEEGRGRAGMPESSMVHKLLPALLSRALRPGEEQPLVVQVSVQTVSLLKEVLRPWG